MDEIKNRRDQKQAEEEKTAIVEKSEDFMGSLLESKIVQDFYAWCEENMPYDHIGCQANGLVGGMQGMLIDTWLGAGADPEKLKEYLARFVDMSFSLRS